MKKSKRNELSLQEFVSQKGQVEAAKILNMTQGGISRALSKTARNIIVEINGDNVKAFEIRPFPYKETS